MRETKYYILILYFIYIIMDLELNKTIIDIEKYYSTQILEMPANIETLIWFINLKEKKKKLNLQNFSFLDFNLLICHYLLKILKIKWRKLWELKKLITQK